MLSGMSVKRSLSAGGADVITLSGTTSPGHNVASDSTTEPDQAEAGWRFNTDGTVDKNENTVYTQFQTGVEWSDLQPTPGQDYWIRFTVDSGNDPDIGVLNTWLKVAGAASINREVAWQLDFIDVAEASVKAEIAEDSGGSTIVATGYYGADLEVSS